MDFILIKIAIRRFFELLLTNAMISIVITYLHVGEVLVTKASLFAALLAGITVFIFINVRMLRQCFFELRSNSLYFLINISAYAAFVAVSLAVFCFGSKECFTWIFAIAKFARFSYANLANRYSFLLFHIIGILMIFLAPVGMDWVFMQSDIEQGEKED